jgi:hypothetical protein
MNPLISCQANFLTFFKLDIPLPALNSIFSGVANFVDLLGARRPTEIAPGIAFGPPIMPISQYKTTRIEYIGERYLLRQNGPIAELVELNQLLPSLFEKQKYSLGDNVRYCELDTEFTPLMGRGVIEWVHSHVKADMENLSKACGEELKTFSFWATNSDTPLSDEWLNVVIQPDLNSPHSRLLWRITKRTKTHSELAEFLKKVNPIIEELGRMFGA